MKIKIDDREVLSAGIILLDGAASIDLGTTPPVRILIENGSGGTAVGVDPGSETVFVGVPIPREGGGPAYCNVSSDDVAVTAWLERLHPGGLRLTYTATLVSR